MADQGFALVFLQYQVDDLGQPTAQGGGEAFHLRLVELFGGGEQALQLFGDEGEAAQAGAFLAQGGGVEGGDGMIEACLLYTSRCV